jgi:leucyl-tRNA synthetase
VRWRRMMGDNVLYVPGTDHAGIATQTVVERRLQKEKKVRRRFLLPSCPTIPSDLQSRNAATLSGSAHAARPRQRGVHRRGVEVEGHARQSHQQPTGTSRAVSPTYCARERSSHVPRARTHSRMQRRLGTSLDWSREVFTMDPQRSKAVTEAFVRYACQRSLLRLCCTRALISGAAPDCTTRASSIGPPGS